MELIKDTKKKLEVKRYIQICSEHIEETGQLVILAEKLAANCKLSSRDALHIAAVLLNHVNYFITCDDELERKTLSINRFANSCLGYGIKIKNPINFLLELNT